MVITVLFYIFVAVAVLQITYYLVFLTFVKKPKPNNITENTLGVSVLVCAKNEEKNLQELVPLLLKQNHSNFELVLINDGSTDKTLDVITKFSALDPRVKPINVVRNESFWGNKKYALTLGIKASSFENLLFTDADCKPISNNWITLMTQPLDSKSIVLGYGPYITQKRTLTNLLVQYETLLTATQYFSYAKLGIPYMGVGRNLAYKRDLFYNNKGFISHIQLKSGDDDLFIQEAATPNNITIEIQPDSFMFSGPPKNLQKLFIQKRRHVTTSKFYKKKHKFLLGLFFLSKVVFFSTLLVLLFNYSFLKLLPFIALYYLINYISLGISSKQLNETRVLYYLPFLDIFLMLFQFTIFIANRISKPTHWK